MEVKAVKEARKVIKILGVHFTHNHSLFYKMNFETIEKSLRESLKGWSWRGASLISTKKYFIKKIIIEYIYLFGRVRTKLSEMH